jgi:hypothetical protein
MLEGSDVEFGERGPEEPDHLAGDCRRGDLFRLLGSEAVKDLEETVLAFPGVGEDGRILALLAAPERGTDCGPSSVVPGGLNEHMANSSVAGLGDGSETSSITGRVLAGHEPEVGHELPRALEAADVAELGSEDHGRLSLEATEAHDAVDDGLCSEA